jgi:hypothetical protein
LRTPSGRALRASESKSLPIGGRLIGWRERETGKDSASEFGLALRILEPGQRGSLLSPGIRGSNACGA